MSGSVFRFPSSYRELLLPPQELSVEELAKLHEERDRAVEDAIGSGQTEYFEASMAGAVATSTGSTPYQPWQTGTVDSIKGRLGTAGTSTTTVNLRNSAGTIVATLTFGSGVTTATATSIGYKIAAGESLYWDVTAAGTGAKDLSVQGKIT